MNQDDFIRFRSLMKALESVFANREDMTKEKLILYYEALKDLKIEDIQLKVEWLIKYRVEHWLPTPAEIRKVREIKEENLKPLPLWIPSDEQSQENARRARKIIEMLAKRKVPKN